MATRSTVPSTVPSVAPSAAPSLELSEVHGVEPHDENTAVADNSPSPRPRLTLLRAASVYLRFHNDLDDEPVWQQGGSAANPNDVASKEP